MSTQQHCLPPNPDDPQGSSYQPLSDHAECHQLDPAGDAATGHDHPNGHPHDHPHEHSRPATTGHGHGHSHAHLGDGNRTRLAIALAISLTILVAEVIGAVISGSLALLADAGHVVTDATGLTLALVAANLTRRPTTDRRTWGFHRAEVLAAAAQAAVLLAVGGFVLVEGTRRLFEPPEVHSGSMVIFGIVGLVGNLVAIGVLVGSRGHNLNMRAAFLEVVADALGSLAVVVAALAVMLTGWLRADAVASLVIGALILPRTWTLLRESVDVLLESTPPGLQLDEVRDHMVAVPGVLDVHDLHASRVATGLPVLTAHVVVDDGAFHDGRLPAMLDLMQRCVAGHFDVEHSTIQFESRHHSDHEPGAHP